MYENFNKPIVLYCIALHCIVLYCIASNGYIYKLISFKYSVYAMVYGISTFAL